MRERGKEVHVAIARAWEREKREVNLETYDAIETHGCSFLRHTWLPLGM